MSLETLLVPTNIYEFVDFTREVEGPIHELGRSPP